MQTGGSNNFLSIGIGLSLAAHLAGMAVVSLDPLPKHSLAVEDTQTVTVQLLDIAPDPAKLVPVNPPEREILPEPEPVLPNPVPTAPVVRSQKQPRPAAAQNRVRTLNQSTPNPRPAPPRQQTTPGGGLPGQERPGGGELNVGSRSSQGDMALPAGGNTPMGWVPGEGSGRGSGRGPGQGNRAPVGQGTGQPAPVVPQPPVEQPRPAPPPPRPEPREEPRPEPVQHQSQVAQVEKEKLLSSVRPSIPGSVRTNPLDVSVTVQFTVSTTGSVTGVSVADSSGISALDKAATDAVSKWKYSPAKQGGVPREVRKTATFHFKR